MSGFPSDPVVKNRLVQGTLGLIKIRRQQSSSAWEVQCLNPRLEVVSCAITEALVLFYKRSSYTTVNITSHSLQ